MAFSRLEEMVAQLDAIQQEDARLTQAREARRLRDARDRAATLEAEINSYQETCDRALASAREAAAADDDEKAGRDLLIVRAYDELRYTRLATMQRAQDELRKLLESTSLTLDDPLDEHALSDAEYGELDARLRAFQEEYQRLFALCMRLEGLGLEALASSGPREGD